MERSIISWRNYCRYASSRPIGILSNFLTDDIGGRSLDSLIEWVNNDAYDFSILNYSYLKKHGDKINIYFLYDGYGKEEHEDREKFETTKNDLIDIAKQWQEVYKMEYTYTLLFLEDGKITMSGQYPRAEQKSSSR